MLQYLKCFLYIALMIAIPSTGLYPHTPAITVHVHETPQELLENNRLLSYDEVLSFLENLENGTLEKICSEDDLEQINIFLANLAEQGMLPNDTEENYAIASDIHELLYGADNTYKYVLDFDSDYIFAPVLLNSQGKILLCKSWFSKKWEQTKEFVKKHKKAIIIGAAVVVAATVVVCAVAAASTAGVVAASSTTAKAAGIAGAAVSAADTSSSSDKKNDKTSTSHKEHIEQPLALPLESFSAIQLPSFLTTLNKTPMLGEMFQENVFTFKEIISHDPIFQTPSINNAITITEEFSSWRNLGSELAHQVLDGVDQLVGYVPQLLEEIKDMSKLILPSLPPPPSDTIALLGSPKENWEKTIAFGHEKIDQLFSTKKSFWYTPQGKEITANSPRGQWNIATLPPPQAFLGNSGLRMKQLVDAGKKLDKGQFSKAGRGLTKHGYREGSVFPKPVGNPAQVNAQGQEILESILHHPDKKIIAGEFERYGKVIDIYAPDIGGVRYTIEGEFIGFLEP